MTEHTFIFAKITPKSEFYQVAKQAIIDIIPQTRNEVGCITFTLHEDGSGSLYLYEQWLDDAALALHYDMDYTKAVFKAYQNWLATTPEITKLIKVV